MDALIAAIMEMPHGGDCLQGVNCSCGVYDLMRDVVIIKADLAVRLNECRGEALKAVGDLLESFKTK